MPHVREKALLGNRQLRLAFAELRIQKQQRTNRVDSVRAPRQAPAHVRRHLGTPYPHAGHKLARDVDTAARQLVLVVSLAMDRSDDATKASEA